MTGTTRAWGRLLPPLLLAACGGGGGSGNAPSPPPAPLATYAAWIASPQDLTEALPGAPQPGPPLFSGEMPRQFAHLSMGGTKLRLKLSNLFGAAPVAFTAVRVARSTGPSSIDASTDRAVPFGGSASVTIAAGADIWSDDIDFPAARGSDVAVSLSVAANTPAQTGHLSPTGTAYFLTEIDASGTQKANVVVAFGDSITDGTGSTPGANLSYPSQLSARVAGEIAPPISVVNAGIGGNRWLFDFPGPSGGARFERDVLGVQGVTHAIVLLGINDLEVAHVVASQQVTLDQLVAATQSAVGKARARGVKVVLGTLLPYKGSAFFAAADETVREGYNAWVRSQATGDGIVDFDAVLRDPADPLAIAPALSSPDHLHPNDAGYAAMAAAVDLAKLR